MLKDKVIIYDDSCPMCKLYTYWFVAWGFLEPENRIGFAMASSSITSRIDLDRGRHEIPLYDRATGETIYGLSALTFILASRWGWLKPFFDSRLFYRMFHPIYQIITYNRRVIAGCKACCGFDCAPDLNRFYRSVYLGMTAVVTGTIVGLLAVAGTTASAVGLCLAVAILIFVTLLGLRERILNGPVAAWDAAGNLATTMVVVCGLLTPLLIWPTVPIWAGCLIAGTASVVGGWEIFRRTR